MKRKGFTLFELLISISIIGILTALAVVSYSQVQKKARDAKIIQDLDLIQKAAESYNADYGHYPDLNSWVTGTKWSDSNGNTILGMFPSDPKGNQYIYHSDVNAPPYIKYCLCGPLENPSGNSSSNHCDWATGATATFYCIQQQQ